MELAGAREDLNLFSAIKEIVDTILRSAARNVDHFLHIQVKSSAKSISSSSRGWFYIKVLTFVSLQKETFTEQGAWPALCAVLQGMPELGEESHLCLHAPDPGADHDQSVRYSYVLHGSSLQLHHQDTRPTPTDATTLYLRMYQNLFHVIEQCREIHNYLMLIKVFRPQWDMAFNMKLGDVQSRNDFRVESCRRISEKLPRIVTDSGFYLSSSEQALPEMCSSAYHAMPAHIDVTIKPGSSGLPCEEVSCGLSTACLVIPRPQQMEKTCVLVMTLYGPGLVPLETEGRQLLRVLDRVSWSQFGLRSHSTENARKHVPFPCHSIVALEADAGVDGLHDVVVVVFLLLQLAGHSSEGLQFSTMDIDCSLEQHSAEFVHCIEGVLEKAFLPLHQKVKMRQLTERSITSVCKAVMDVVTMSDCEQFRSSILACMQIEDTVDLGGQLESRLTSISRHKQQGLWSGTSTPASRMAKQREELEDSRIEVSPDIMMGAEKRRKLGSPLANPVTDHSTLAVSPTTHSSDIYPKVSPFNELADSDAKSVADPESSVEHFTGIPDEKPEIATQRSDTHPKVSPFHELADSDDESVEEAESRRVGHVADVPDKTPEIAQITAGLQQVSPFQELCHTELAEHCHGNSVAWTEDPFKVDKGCGELCPVSENTHLSSEKTIMNNTQGLNKLKSDNCYHSVEEIFTQKDRPKEAEKIEAYVNGRVTLNNKELLPTFNVISSFIDSAAADILHSGGKVNNGDINTGSGRQETPHSSKSDEPDSDDWFNDVLEEVEDWLN